MISDSQFKNELELLIANAIREDVGAGDYSSLACVPASAKGNAKLLVKEDGIIAGLAFAKMIFDYVDAGLQLETFIEDGAAVKKGDVYVVNGSKTFITNGYNADLVIVAARTSPEKKSKGITLFAVETGMEGFERGRKLDKVGQHESDTAELFFENVRVPVSHRLGDEGKGFIQVMQGFDFSRALIGLQVLAVAQVALEEAWDYVAQREAFGKPLASFQGVSHTLADFDTQVYAARLMCLHVTLPALTASPCAPTTPHPMRCCSTSNRCSFSLCRTVLPMWRACKLSHLWLAYSFLPPCR